MFGKYTYMYLIQCELEACQSCNKNQREVQLKWNSKPIPQPADYDQANKESFPIAIRLRFD